MLHPFGDYFKIILCILYYCPIPDDVPAEEILDAAKNCSNFQNAHDYLNQECMICFTRVSVPKVKVDSGPW